MFNLDREPLFSGQPMLLEDLNEEEVQRLDVENLSVLSIDQVRETLPDVERQLSTLQAIVDEAHDMTEEIEILLESLPPEHPHVVEMSELLGGLVAHWQQTIAKIIYFMRCSSTQDAKTKETIAFSILPATYCKTTNVIRLLSTLDAKTHENT